MQQAVAVLSRAGHALPCTRVLKELHTAASRSGARAACAQCEHMYQSRSVRTRLGVCILALMEQGAECHICWLKGDRGQGLVLCAHSGALGEMP